MKKNFITILLILFCAFSFCLGAGCFNLDGGDDNISRERSDKMVNIMDATFNSAEYIVTSSSDKGGGKGKASKMSASTRAVSPTTPSYWLQLELLTSNFLGTGGGVPLTEDNKKALKGEALSGGSGYAAMVRAFTEIYGDKVFEETYVYQQITFKITENDGAYTIYGILNEDGKMRSGFTMTFTEETDGTYSYIYAEYSVQYSDTNPYSSLRISSFAPNGIVNTELTANSDSIFSNYESAYDQFKISKMTCAFFAMANYASVEYYGQNQASKYQVELTMKFANEILGFGNHTFANLSAIRGSTTISDADLIKISNIVSSSYYVSPYYYQTNNSYVRDVYVVPQNVTVIKTGSIPATKEIQIHGGVTKIESRPFQQPQHLESIRFLDPTTNKLKQIGSFDDITSTPTFILSMTKVKNFILPSSVEKLELGDYVLNTEVELLDLSAYNPTWLTDHTKFTYNFRKADVSDYEKDRYRNDAYTTLHIGGSDDFYYRDLRYIHTLKMPSFNMGIDFYGPSHYSVKDASNTEFYSEAFSDFNSLLKFYDGDYSQLISNLGYTRAFETIDTVIFRDKTDIVPSSLLYSDLSGKKGEVDEREDFDFVLYGTTMNSNNYYEDYGKLFDFARINTFQLPSSIYFNATTVEQSQFNRVSSQPNKRPTLIIKGANGLSFEKADVNEVYLLDGSAVAPKNVSVGATFFAPNLTGSDAVITEGGVRKYFAGWSFTENGSLSYLPFEKIKNNNQTLYPVYLPTNGEFNYSSNNDGTYSAEYISNSCSDQLLIIPNQYNGKPITRLVGNASSAYDNTVKKIIVTEGITVIGDYAFRKIALELLVLPKTISEINSVRYDEDWAVRYDNAYYLPLGSNPYGLLVKGADAYDEDFDYYTSCEIHPKTQMIFKEAFYGFHFTQVTIPSSVESIGYLAFSNSYLQKVTIPSSVRNYGTGVFIDCDYLTEVKISNGVTQLGLQMFDGCDNLRKVTLASTLKNLPADAFDNCPNLEGNVWNNGVYLGSNTSNYFALINVVDLYVETFSVHQDTAFISLNIDDYCDATTVNIASNVKSIDFTLFGEFHNIEKINFAGSQKDWNQILFTGYETCLTWQQALSDDTYSSWIEDVNVKFA